MDQKTMDLAQYIFSNGRFLHERIMQIQTDFHSSHQVCKCGELTMAQIHAIKTIHQLKNTSISTLAKTLKVSLPSASVMVDRLVEKGMVNRSRSTEDRRKVVISLAPQVAEDIQQLEMTILQTFIELVEKIGPETAQKWCEVLEKVGQVLNQKR